MVCNHRDIIDDWIFSKFINFDEWILFIARWGTSGVHAIMTFFLCYEMENFTI